METLVNQKQSAVSLTLYKIPVCCNKMYASFVTSDRIDQNCIHSVKIKLIIIVCWKENLGKFKPALKRLYMCETVKFIFMLKMNMLRIDRT